MIHKKKRFVFKLQTLDNEDRTYQNETTWTWRKLSKLYIKRNALNHRFRISATQCYPKMFKLLRGNCIRTSLLFFHKWYSSPSKMGRLIKLWHGRSWVIIFKKTTHIYEIAMSVTFHHWIYWCWHLTTTICIYICILFCLVCFLGLAMIHIQDKIRFWNKSFTYSPFLCQKFYIWCFGV